MIHVERLAQLARIGMLAVSLILIAAFCPNKTQSFGSLPIICVSLEFTSIRLSMRFHLVTQTRPVSDDAQRHKIFAKICQL
jgi:hypothetical protein